MKKFEYETDSKWETTSNRGRGSLKEKEYLKERGENGWELVSVTIEDLGRETIYYWKREII